MTGPNRPFAFDLIGKLAEWGLCALIGGMVMLAYLAPPEVSIIL